MNINTRFIRKTYIKEEEKHIGSTFLATNNDGTTIGLIVKIALLYNCSGARIYDVESLVQSIYDDFLQMPHNIVIDISRLSDPQLNELYEEIRAVIPEVCYGALMMVDGNRPERCKKTFNF